MRRFIYQFLSFFGLTDKHWNLSLSNIAVIILLWRMGVSDYFDWPMAAALLFVLLNYIHKRHESVKVIKAEAELIKYDVLFTNISALSAKLDTFEQGYAAIAKQAEDTKKLLSTTNVNHAFGASRRARGQEGV